MTNRLARLIKNEDELKIDDELTIKLKAYGNDYVDINEAIEKMANNEISKSEATRTIIDVVVRMAAAGSDLNEDEKESFKILLLTKRGDLVFEALEKLGFVKEGTFREQIELLRKKQQTDEAKAGGNAVQKA